eukprot:2379546-Rhodomonas_salina.1
MHSPHKLEEVTGDVFHSILKKRKGEQEDREEGSQCTLGARRKEVRNCDFTLPSLSLHSCISVTLSIAKGSADTPASVHPLRLTLRQQQHTFTPERHLLSGGYNTHEVRQPRNRQSVSAGAQHRMRHITQRMHWAFALLLLLGAGVRWEGEGDGGRAGVCAQEAGESVRFEESIWPQGAARSL